MKNDSKMIKLIAIVLLVTIVALILVSGTFAKYTSTTSGTAKAYVATWNVTLNGEKLEEATFDVFSTVYDTDGGTEDDVLQADKTTTIAPGTSGQFTLSIVNKSDVTASISLTLTKATDSADVPLEFSTDKSTWKTDIANVLNDEAKNVSAGSSYEPTIYWRWAYDGVDTTDTGLGEASYTASTSGTRTSYNATVSVTATQAD